MMAFYSEGVAVIYIVIYLVIYGLSPCQSAYELSDWCSDRCTVLYHLCHTMPHYATLSPQASVFNPLQKTLLPSFIVFSATIDKGLVFC